MQILQMQDRLTETQVIRVWTNSRAIAKKSYNNESVCLRDLKVLEQASTRILE